MNAEPSWKTPPDLSPLLLAPRRWFSADGGHNFKMGNLPAGGGSFDYVRLPGSRSEPAGQAFALMNAPDPLPPSAARSDGGLLPAANV